MGASFISSFTCEPQVPQRWIPSEQRTRRAEKLDRLPNLIIIDGLIAICRQKSEYIHFFVGKIERSFRIPIRTQEVAIIQSLYLRAAIAAS